MIFCYNAGMNSKEKTKMTRNIVPDNFTITLALVDALPVLFFGATMILIGTLFSHPLFLAGAILTTITGAVKVLWKIIVVLKKKNIWWMFVQMRMLMPVGFFLMLLSLILGRNSLSATRIWKGLISFPSVFFFIIGVIGMATMILFAAKLDSSDSKANWIEQATNGVAQASFFVGVLIIIINAT